MEQESTGRVEQGRQDLHGGQAAREFHVAEGRDDDKRGDEQGYDHPRAEKGVARAGFVLLLFGNAPFTSRAEDGDDGGHGASIQVDGVTSKQGFMGRRDKKVKKTMVVE